MTGDRTAEAGFVTLDVLVAVILFGFVGVMLAGVLQFGLRATGFVEVLRSNQGSIEATERALRRLIASADLEFAPASPVMRGSSSVIAFTTNFSTHTSERQAEVIIGGENGELILQWAPKPHIISLLPAVQPERLVLVNKLQSIEFAYQATTGVWSDYWDGPGLPAIIRIELVFRRGSGRRWPPIVVSPLRMVLR